MFQEMVLEEELFKTKPLMVFLVSESQYHLNRIMGLKKAKA